MIPKLRTLVVVLAAGIFIGIHSLLPSWLEFKIADAAICLIAWLTWQSSLKIEVSTQGTKKAAENAANDAALRFRTELIRQDWIALHRLMMKFEALRHLQSFNGWAREGKYSGSPEVSKKFEQKLLYCQAQMFGQLKRMTEEPLHMEIVDWFDKALESGRHLTWESGLLPEFLKLRNKVAERCDPIREHIHTNNPV